MKNKQNKTEGSWQPLRWVCFLILYCFDFDKLMISGEKNADRITVTKWSRDAHPMTNSSISGEFWGMWGQGVVSEPDSIPSVEVVARSILGRICSHYPKYCKSLTIFGKSLVRWRHAKVRASKTWLMQPIAPVLVRHPVCKLLHSKKYKYLRKKDTYTSFFFTPYVIRIALPLYFQENRLCI